jgi:hypothetical protein
VLLLEVAVSVVLASKLLATRRVFALEKRALTANCPVVAAKILLQGETFAILTRITLEEPLVCLNMLAIAGVSIRIS